MEQKNQKNEGLPSNPEFLNESIEQLDKGKAIVSQLKEVMADNSLSTREKRKKALEGVTEMFELMNKNKIKKKIVMTQENESELAVLVVKTVLNYFKQEEFIEDLEKTGLSLNEETEIIATLGSIVFEKLGLFLIPEAK